MATRHFEACTTTTTRILERNNIHQQFSFSNMEVMRQH
jgi:hypothetical protein